MALNGISSPILAAWEKSIDVAASTGPAGGYIVSRHFYRLAEQRVGHSAENGAERDKLADLGGMGKIHRRCRIDRTGRRIHCEPALLPPGGTARGSFRGEWR